MFISKEHKNVNGEKFNTEQIENSIFTENQMAKQVSNLLLRPTCYTNAVHISPLYPRAIFCRATGLAVLSIHFLNTTHRKGR